MMIQWVQQDNVRFIPQQVCYVLTQQSVRLRYMTEHHLTLVQTLQLSKQIVQMVMIVQLHLHFPVSGTTATTLVMLNGVETDSNYCICCKWYYINIPEAPATGDVIDVPCINNNRYDCWNKRYRR